MGVLLTCSKEDMEIEEHRGGERIGRISGDINAYLAFVRLGYGSLELPLCLVPPHSAHFSQHIKFTKPKISGAEEKDENGRKHIAMKAYRLYKTITILQLHHVTALQRDR